MENKNYSQNKDYEDIDLRDVVDMLAKRKKIIIFCALAGLGIAWAASLIIPKTYRVQMTMEVGTIERSGSKLVPVIDIVQVKDKIERGVYSPEGGAGFAIKTVNTSGSGVITMIVDAADSRAAADFLKTIGSAVIADHNQVITNRRQKIESQIKTLVTNAEEIKTDPRYLLASDCSTERYLAVNTIENRILDLELALTQFNDTAIITGPAASQKPIKPNVATNAVLGLVLGLFFGVFIAFVRNWWQESEKGK